MRSVVFWIVSTVSAGVCQREPCTKVIFQIFVQVLLFNEFGLYLYTQLFNIQKNVIQKNEKFFSKGFAVALEFGFRDLYIIINDPAKMFTKAPL